MRAAALVLAACLASTTVADVEVDAGKGGAKTMDLPAPRWAHPLRRPCAIVLLRVCGPTPPCDRMHTNDQAIACTRTNATRIATVSCLERAVSSGCAYKSDSKSSDIDCVTICLVLTATRI